MKEFIIRRYAASFNWERVGFRSRWFAVVIYLKRETYEVWVFGKCWTNISTTAKQLKVDFNRAVLGDSRGRGTPVFIPFDPEMQPFDMVMAGGLVASFSMKTNMKVGEQIRFWGKPYVVSNREERDGFVRYSLTPAGEPAS